MLKSLHTGPDPLENTASPGNAGVSPANIPSRGGESLLKQGDIGRVDPRSAHLRTCESPLKKGDTGGCKHIHLELHDA